MTELTRDEALQIYRALMQIENGAHALRVMLEKKYALKDQPRRASNEPATEPIPRVPVPVVE